nr:MAG TPA: hypothetical protein [Caudoviricetes sp.]
MNETERILMLLPQILVCIMADVISVIVLLKRHR